MKPVSILYGDWISADAAPFEPKNLKKFLDDGNAAIIATAGLSTLMTGITEDAINTGNVLFINLKTKKPQPLYDNTWYNLFTAIGYLVQDEGEDAGTLFYNTCVENAKVLSDSLWEKQCRFNENYSGFRTMDNDTQSALQDVFPDDKIFDKLLSYLNRNERKLKADIAEFTENTVKGVNFYRKNIVSSHLTVLSDEEYLSRFSADAKELKELYKVLKNTIKEMRKIPELFGCTNYLLRGGEYRDIKGFCKLVSVEEIENHNWSLKPEDYV